MPMEKWIEIDGVAARRVDLRCVAKSRVLGAAPRWSASRVWVGAMTWAPSDLGTDGVRA